MCFGDDARPPAPPVRGPVGDHGDLVLTSADGTRFAAYHAHPAGESTRSIVVMPDVRGLHTFYKELAYRWAEAGVHAVAIDYFGRTAGLTGRDEEFPFREHVEQTKPELIASDVAAAVTYLREQTGASSVYTVGFCFGGSSSWAQSAAGHGLNGAIGFYGIPSRVESLVPRLQAPLLMLAAGNDFTPVETVEAFAAEVRGVVEADLTVFPGAPHSFFDRSYAEHQEACARSWELMLDFVNRHADA